LHLWIQRDLNSRSGKEKNLKGGKWKQIKSIQEREEDN
jgi:hypothetical protein